MCSLNVKDDLQIVRSSIQEAEDYIGKCVDVLVNCAGNFFFVYIILDSHFMQFSSAERYLV